MPCQVRLSSEEASALHVLPRAELNRRIAAGVYATAETCDDPQPGGPDFAAVYAKQTEIAGCTVYQDRR